MQNTLPRVSIIIPAYNESDSIRACLQAALMQTSLPHEIIVVDNKSTDDTVAIVRAVQRENPDAPLTLISQDEEQGLIPTRNRGFAEATGDVLGRIDADSVIEPTWVAEVQRVFSDPGIDAATGPVLYYDMPLRRWGLKADDRTRRLILRLKRTYHFLFGSNMAIRSTAWHIIKDSVCRDEVDEMHEDIDLSIHLAQHGLTVTYSSHMISGMSARRIENSPREYSYYVRRFERTYKNHGLRDPRLRAPMAVFFAIYPAAKIMRKVRQRREAAFRD